MTDTYVLSQCMISLAIIFFIWRSLIARQQREAFRSKIRTIRDELFDFMWKNGYDFNDPAYRSTRQTLNGLLRLSNTLGTFEFVVLVVRTHNTRRASEGCKSLKALKNAELRSALEGALAKAVSEWVRFMFLTGFCGLFVRTLFLVFGTITFVAHFRKWIRRKMTSFLHEAHEFGEPNLSATSKALLLKCSSH